MEREFENSAMAEAFAGLNLSDIPERRAEISAGDRSITGGRPIVEMKSRQLFTGQFEKSDADEFIAIWSYYRTHLNMSLDRLKADLMTKARAMHQNYRGEVCPIEVMLYTSNLAAKIFVSNKNLIDKVAEVVYEIYKMKNDYLNSIEHILRVWKWEQAINVCAVAVGKIGDIDLLRYIYDEFNYQVDLRYGCFRALMNSKNDECIPYILNMVHDFKYREKLDKEMCGIFRSEFLLNFPSGIAELDDAKFLDSDRYVQNMIKQMRGGSDYIKTKFDDAATLGDKELVLEQAVKRLVDPEGSDGGNPVDAVKLLRGVNSPEINNQIFLSLNPDSKAESTKKFLTVLAMTDYFGEVNYPPALKAFTEVSRENDYYPAARVALFKQGKISNEDFVWDFLSESVPERVKIYLKGFWIPEAKIADVRECMVNYLSEELEPEIFSTAINNYLQLIQQRRTIFDRRVGELIRTWFCYKTVFGTVKIRLPDQNTCLRIIDVIVDRFNFDDYANFLYYVAKQGNFQPAIAAKAESILKKFPAATIKV